MRGFSEAEREDIREALVAAGEEYFVRFGPRRTTVEDLTEEVGIAKGSFYNFFDSKAALFMEVFRRLGKAQVDSVLAAVEEVEDGRVGIRLLFEHYVDWLEANPIIRRLAADADRSRFRRSLPADQFASAERERDERLAEPVERWQANGSIRDDVPATAIVGLMQPLLTMAVTTDEYDDEYRRRRDFHIETLARGVEAEPTTDSPEG